MPNSKELINLLALTPLEKHALLSSRDGRLKIFTCYLAMREKVATDFLPLINSREPFINDHTRLHLERVLWHIESILEHNFPRPQGRLMDIPEDRVMTWVDSLILLNALVWHDIGNMYGRKQHGRQVRSCLNAISPRLYDEHMSKYVIQVAQAHSGENAIENEIPSSHAARSYRREAMHLQFLAAVLRFADEIDEDHRRSSPDEWDQMRLIPKQNQRFWYFCKANSSIQVKPITGDNNISYWVTIESHIPESEFDRKLWAGRKKVKCLSEYFRRLLKFENERNYCNRFLRTSYYHPGISGFKVHLTTHERTESPATGQPFNLEFSDASGVEQLISDPRNSGLINYIIEAREIMES